MSRGILKVVGGLAAVAVLLAALLVLVVHARQKGRLSYCRNNLRMLGIMAHSELGRAPDEPPEERGRAFWQWVREQKFKSTRGQWIQPPRLNPFGCPVRGRAPLDLTALSREEYERHMSDPSTIDYRGPRTLPAPLAGQVMLGSDREGNHPSRGHVLLTDLSVHEKQDRAIAVTDELWVRAAVETGE